MRLLVVIVFLLIALPAHAQSLSQALVVSSCGTPTLTVGGQVQATMDTTGRLCSHNTGGGGPTTAPVNSAAPVASGTAIIASALSCSTGTWTQPPITSYAYQWKRGASNIAGATSSAYTTVSADGGQSLTCVVTATNAIGASLPATSNALAILGVPANSVAPVASGLLTVGSTLSCTTGTWSNSPTSYAYTWLRGGTPISGATSASYVTVSADGGTSVGCAVVATNASGNSASVASNTLVIAAAGGCVAATNYLARTSGGNEGGNAANITTLICGLVTDGVITGNLSGARGCGTFLDVLYIGAQATSADSMLNLCGTSFSLTNVNTVVFTPYTGWSAFFTNTSYLTTGFNPAIGTPNFSINSASYGFWTYAVGAQEVAVQMGTYTGATTFSFIQNSYTNYRGNILCARINNH